MGRGKGGSTSHGKRTPDGIQTSSAMKMSRVGEVEAKDGVLGGNSGDIGAPDRIESPEGLRDVERRVEAGMINNAVQALLRKQFKKGDKEPTPAELQAILQTPEGRMAQRINEAKAKEYILSSKSLQDERDRRVEAMGGVKPTGDRVFTPDVNAFENYYLHTDRTQDEIDEKFNVEGNRFSRHVFPNEIEGTGMRGAAGENNGRSAEQWYEQAGFLGLVYHKALVDPSMRELFLKLWSLSGELEGENSALSKDRLEREQRIAGHIEDTWKAGKSVLDESADDLHYSERDPMLRGTGQTPVYDAYYYKLLLSNPETRAMLAEAEKKQKLMKAGGGRRRTWGSYWADGKAGTPPLSAVKATLEQNMAPMPKVGFERINKIKEALGQMPVAVPAYALEALKGQPVSQHLFALADFDDTDYEIADYADLFDVSRDDIEESIKDYNKHGEDAGLTDGEKYAVVMYTSHGYDRVNDYLRTLTTTFDAYSQAKDKDVKEAMTFRLYHMLKDVSGDRAMAALTMRGMAKLIAARGKSEPRTVTRGSGQAPGTKLGMAEGKYFYDPGVTSTSLRENWHSDWAGSGTQYVLVTDKWIDARPFSVIDRDSSTPKDRKEDELMVFPGTMFRADAVQNYKSTKRRVGRLRQDVIWGRQADLSSSDGASTLSPAGLKWENTSPPRDVLSDILPKTTRGRSDEASVNEYASRFGKIGDTLYHWLYDSKAREK